MERDLDSFLALQALARSLELPDITEYWKSAPHLVNFMDDYDLKRKLVDVLAGPSVPAEIVCVLSSGTNTLLSREDVSAYRQLDPGEREAPKFVA